MRGQIFCAPRQKVLCAATCSSRSPGATVPSGQFVIELPQQTRQFLRRNTTFGDYGMWSNHDGYVYMLFDFLLIISV